MTDGFAETRRDAGAVGRAPLLGPFHPLSSPRPGVSARPNSLSHPALRASKSQSRTLALQWKMERPSAGEPIAFDALQGTGGDIPKRTAELPPSPSAGTPNAIDALLHLPSNPESIKDGVHGIPLMTP